MNYGLFRGLIDRYAKKEITRSQFIQNWRLIQRYMRIFP
jgi:hypothetical protein